MLNLDIGRKSFKDYNIYRRKRAEESILHLENFTEIKEKKVLDIGCGHGSNAFILAQKGSYVTALDIDEERLSVARNLNNHENINFINTDLNKLANKKFQLVTLLDVLEHIQNYEDLIKNVVSLIDQDSLVYIEYNPYFSFIGHHLYDYTLLPVQFLPYKLTEKIVLSNSKSGGIFNAEESLKQFKELNKITCRKLRKILKTNNFKIVFERNYIKIPGRKPINTSIFRYIPYLEDLFSASHILILKINK